MHQAELDIASTHRERTRSMSVFSNATGITHKTSATDMAIPGAWSHTPKRKREHAPKSGELDLESEMRRSRKGTGRPWTVRDWKNLEKVFIAEKSSWVQEREVKQMPGGFTSWATKSFRAPEAVKEWDADRVVNRFLDREGVQDDSGEWAR